MNGFIQNIRKLYDICIAIIFLPLFFLAYTVGNIWGLTRGSYIMGRCSVKFNGEKLK